ncbi:MAG: hypothetical protein C6I01_01505 [Epsilonproteobacteria bacterium]|nr:hypothetical protein [Campylobacterota bacterium]
MTQPCKGGVDNFRFFVSATFQWRQKLPSKGRGDKPLPITHSQSLEKLKPNPIFYLNFTGLTLSLKKD